MNIFVFFQISVSDKLELFDRNESCGDAGPDKDSVALISEEIVLSLLFHRCVYSATRTMNNRANERAKVPYQEQLQSLMPNWVESE